MANTVLEVPACVTPFRVGNDVFYNHRRWTITDISEYGVVSLNDGIISCSTRWEEVFPVTEAGLRVVERFNTSWVNLSKLDLSGILNWPVISGEVSTRFITTMQKLHYGDVQGVIDAMDSASKFFAEVTEHLTQVLSIKVGGQRLFSRQAPPEGI